MSGADWVRDPDVTGDTDVTGNTDEFDYIVVGAGSAGCALAARLSEDPTSTILVLEAGGSDQRREVRVPAAFPQLFKSDADWGFHTTSQAALAGRSIFWPRGKILGGSSSMNAMMWVTGFAADYDRWGELAGPEWSWQSLEPLFETNGIMVERQRDPRSHTAAFLEACAEIGYRTEHANDEAPDGFSETLVTQQAGERWNAVRGYLEPAVHRGNLFVRTHTLVDRVIFDEDRAVGVEYLKDGVRRTARAHSEVILSAGAIGTPAILMRSGIGPFDELERHGIPLVAESPDVGRNLRDHLATMLAVEAFRDTLFAATTPAEQAHYESSRTGMLTSNTVEAYGFVRSDERLAEPDLEIVMAPVAYVREGLQGVPGHGITVGAVLLQPESRGTVTLASADPHSAPVIDAGYLSDAGGRDRDRLIAGVRVCERILRARTMSDRIGPRYLAPPRGELLGAEARIDQAVTELSHTLYQPTSTARMGLDVDSVVDPELRVRWVSRLRVADASVMPESIRGHAHAAAVVIGEKAARLIRGRAPISMR